MSEEKQSDELAKNFQTNSGVHNKLYNPFEFEEYEDAFDPPRIATEISMFESHFKNKG